MAVTFALIQDGKLTGASNITFVQGVIDRRQRRSDTTNTASGTAHESSLGRLFYHLQANGYWDTGSSTYPRPIGTASSNGPIGRLSRIRLRKQQQLTNATADADGEDDACFEGGVITYYGRGSGYLQSTEAPLGTDSSIAISQAELSSFTIPLDGSHDVTADAILRNIRKSNRFQQGGPVLVDFDFVLTGAVTLNGASNPLDATEFTASLNTDNGDDWSGTVIYDEMELDIDYENGTPTRVSINGPFTGSPAVSISAA